MLFKFHCDLNTQRSQPLFDKLVSRAIAVTFKLFRLRSSDMLTLDCIRGLYDTISVSKGYILMKLSCSAKMWESRSAMVDDAWILAWMLASVVYVLNPKIEILTWTISHRWRVRRNHMEEKCAVYIQLPQVLD